MALPSFKRVAKRGRRDLHRKSLPLVLLCLIAKTGRFRIYPDTIVWRPEYFVELPYEADLLDDTIQETLSNIPDASDMLAAVVLEAKPGKVVARRTDSEPITITGRGLQFASWSLSARAPAAQQIRRGAVIRIVQTSNGWAIRQLPEIESALVTMDPRTGAIKALVGGFDFAKKNFQNKKN